MPRRHCAGLADRWHAAAAILHQNLQVPYLAARALRDGTDIFTPVSDLAARYFPTAADTFPHPDPHPRRWRS